MSVLMQYQRPCAVRFLLPPQVQGTEGVITYNNHTKTAVEDCCVKLRDMTYFEPIGELFAAMADEPRRHKKKGKKHHHKDHGYPRDVPMRDLQKVRRIEPDGV